MWLLSGTASPSASWEEGCVISALELGSTRRGSQETKERHRTCDMSVLCATEGNEAGRGPWGTLQEGCRHRDGGQGRPCRSGGTQVNAGGGERASTQVSRTRDPGEGKEPPVHDGDVSRCRARVTESSEASERWDKQEQHPRGACRPPGGLGSFPA